MNATLIFNISILLDQPIGSRELYSFDGPVKFEEIDIKSNMTGKVEIMKITEGFNVVIKDAKVDVNFECEKCLKKIKKEVFVNQAEGIFYIDKPKEIDDINDLFLLDKKKRTLDCTELLRQELILHFPTNKVCSKSCKGICPVCGKNRNKKDCNCKEVRVPENKPLRNLKDLIKE